VFPKTGSSDSITFFRRELAIQTKYDANQVCWIFPFVEGESMPDSLKLAHSQRLSPVSMTMMGIEAEIFSLWFS
jgi:hypothetical protein